MVRLDLRTYGGAVESDLIGGSPGVVGGVGTDGGGADDVREKTQKLGGPNTHTNTQKNRVCRRSADYRGESTRAGTMCFRARQTNEPQGLPLGERRRGREKEQRSARQKKSEDNPRRPAKRAFQVSPAKAPVTRQRGTPLQFTMRRQREKI